MATPIVMPTLGYMMEEGTVAAWLKQSGEWVERGDPLVEITTEKLNYEVEASAGGYLLSLIEAGRAVPVGQPIGYLLAEGEDAPAATEMPEAPSQQPQGAQASVAATTPTGERQVIASPVARRVARELGVNLSSVTASGPGGRIVEEDVRGAARVAQEVTSSAPAPTIDMPGTVSRVVPLTGIRGAIARRMHQSLQAGAQYTLTLDADVTEALRLRRQFSREQRAAEGGVRFLDVMVKAVAQGLQGHPALNALIIGEEVRWIQEAHIGIAVALEDGLVVPVLRNAHQMSIPDIAGATRDLEARAKTGQLTPEEASGSTFTISLLGTVDAFTPIINPPEVAVLGVGQATEKPAVVKGQVVPRSLVTLSLTLDHRAVDGAPGASFLRRLRRLLEQPHSLFSGGVEEEDAQEEEPE